MGYVESGKLLRRVIALKFLLQDFPQQVFIVLYLYGWYAKNGLRCQMCLFHPAHCEDQHPLHWSNLLACAFTIMSASTNQLMIQAKPRRASSSDEDECCIFCSRAILFSGVLVSSWQPPGAGPLDGGRAYASGLG